MEPRPLAQESETLPPGHRDLRFKIYLQDRRWTATDAIEEGYSFNLFTDFYESVKLKLKKEHRVMFFFFFLFFVTYSTVNRRINIGTAS